MAIAELLKHYAETDKDRETVDAMWTEMRRVNTDDDTIVRTLSGILYDGLAYGNWPWSWDKLR